MALDFSSLKKALSFFEQSMQVTEEAPKNPAWNERFHQTLQAGLIQHFEFTYELSWKFMKRWIVSEAGRRDAEGVSRRELFRIAKEEKLIDDVTAWFEFHQARNLTSHTYNTDTAKEVAEATKKFGPKARLLLSRLEEKNK